MHIMHILVVVALVLVAIPAAAQNQHLEEHQCDTIIAQAFSSRIGGKESVRLLNSDTVRSCFRRYPGLEYKYFPLRSDGNGVLCDRGPMAAAGTGKCPAQDTSRDFPVRFQ